MLCTDSPILLEVTPPSPPTLAKASHLAFLVCPPNLLSSFLLFQFLCLFPGLQGISRSPAHILRRPLGEFPAQFVLPAPSETSPWPPGSEQGTGSQTCPIIGLPLSRPLLRAGAGWAGPLSRGGLFSPPSQQGQRKEVEFGCLVNPPRPPKGVDTSLNNPALSTGALSAASSLSSVGSGAL